MATYNLQTKRGREVFQSNLSLDQAAQLVSDNMERTRTVPWNQDTRNFMNDLLRAYRQWGNRLTPGRQAWIIKYGQEVLTASQYAANQSAGQAQTAGPAPVINPPQRMRIPLGDFGQMIAPFQHAANHKQNPKIRLQTATGQNVVLSVAGPNARFPGTLHVTDGVPKGDGGLYFGRVHLNGEFEPYGNPRQDLLDLLGHYAADPVTTAVEYGKLTGNCSFCDAGLTDERSLHMGYGPVCAKNWGLPWGERPAEGTMGTTVVPIPHAEKWNPEGLVEQPVVVYPTPLSVQASTGELERPQDGLPAPADARPSAPAEQLPEATEAADEGEDEGDDSSEQADAAPVEDETSEDEISCEEETPAGDAGNQLYYRCTNPACPRTNKLWKAEPVLSGVNCPDCGRTAVRSQVATVSVPAATVPAMKPNFGLGMAPKTRAITPTQPVIHPTPAAAPAPSLATGSLTTELPGAVVSYQLLGYARVSFCCNRPEWDAEYKRTTGSTMEDCSAHEFVNYIKWVHDHPAD